MRKKLMVVTIIATFILSIFACGYAVGRDKAENKVWHDNRTTQTVIVKSGDTLWDIAEQYKPDNIDIREYIYDVKTLNNISSTIHEGDTILVYVY